MDAAAPAPRSRPKRGKPLIPPNYVSLRHLQELRLKEKEEQQKREEEEAAARRIKEEQRQREEETAARRAREAAAAPKPEMKASSHTSFGCKERPRGGPRLVVVAHRPPPPCGEDLAMKIDGAAGGCRGTKGPEGDAANAPQGGRGKAENKGKEKVSSDMTGGPGEPAEPATASLNGGKPEEKRKVEASEDQGTASGTSRAPGKPGEAAIASCRGRVRPKYKRKGRKGSGGRNTESSMTSAPGEAADTSPPRGVNLENKGKKGLGGRSTETASASAPGKAANASPPQSVKLENKGKQKPLEGRRADTAPSSNSPDGKRVQPRPAADGSRSRRSGGGQGTTSEAKSEGLGEMQPVVEVRTQSRPAAEGSSNRWSYGGQGMIGEAKSEGLEEKQPVVEVRAAAQRKSWDVRSLGGQQPGGGRGNGAAGQHGRVWVPKAAAALASAEVSKFS